MRTSICICKSSFFFLGFINQASDVIICHVSWAEYLGHFTVTKGTVQLFRPINLRRPVLGFARPIHYIVSAPPSDQLILHGSAAACLPAIPPLRRQKSCELICFFLLSIRFFAVCAFFVPSRSICSIRGALSQSRAAALSVDLNLQRSQELFRWRLEHKSV
jgi:hypothetical protein